MFKKNVAWKEAGWVFMMSRLMIILICLFAFGLIRDVTDHIERGCKGADELPTNAVSAQMNMARAREIPVICIFYHWDVEHYIQIASVGYSTKGETAFFPLWPLIEHVGGIWLGEKSPNTYLLAGILAANICFYFALVLLYWLVSEDFDDSIARRTLSYLAFSPYSFFFFLAYTESLFILLSLGFFLLLRKKSMWAWWCAGLLGLLAMLTRSSGLVLIVPLFVYAICKFLLPLSGSECWQRWKSLFLHLIPILLIPVGLLAYMFYLWQTQGDPLVFSTQEGLIWNRQLSLPWIGIQFALDRILNPDIDTWTRTQNLLDILFTILPLLVLLIGWRRIPLHYICFAVALMIFALIFPIYPYKGIVLWNVQEPLSSLSRYMLVIFPVTVICAIWGTHPRFDVFYMTFVLPFFTLITIMFLAAYWVA